jgi:adenylosuccinate synthase
VRGHAIIGANYGDEGKGLMTDYICAREGADAVVRFNGGAQAGHTVVTPEGQRHVFHHFGAGTFVGVPTFLSRFFVVNPLLFARENVSGVVMVDPRAIVTLPADMLINQASERRVRHGSVGVGINETMQRSSHGQFVITVADMLDRSRYAAVMNEYVPARLRQLGLSLDIDSHWESTYFDLAERFLSAVHVTERPAGRNFVFEGAQGLLLDQDAPGFPHVTHSHTGLRNVRELSAEWGITDLRATYVTRAYVTRHGAGPLPNEEPMPKWVVDETNVPHEFQGTLRYAPLDVLALERAVIRDCGTTPLDLAVTCLDQTGDDILQRFTLPVAYRSYGPTRDSVVPAGASDCPESRTPSSDCRTPAFGSFA